MKEFNDIKVSYLNLSRDYSKKLKITRHSYGVKSSHDKYTPKGSQGIQYASHTRIKLVSNALLCG